MGIPLGVYLSPVVLALAIIVTDVINLVVRMPDLGGAVRGMIDRLIDGDPGAVGAIALVLLIWVIPGIVLLVVSYVLVAWRLRHIGGEGIALGMGGRPPRSDDAQERQLVDIVGELAIAAGIEPPRVLLYDGPSNALVFGRDPDHSTVLVARSVLDDLDREETQGVVARLIASAVDGDLGLAVDIAAVYLTYGLMVTTLASFVSHSARARWRAAVPPLLGRRREPGADAAGVAALLGFPTDDDTPDTTAAGCLSLLTMGGFIGIGVGIINLFLSGPLLAFAWRSRGYLADATAVDLTRDPEGLARALPKLGGGSNTPGPGWLELLLVVSGAGVRSGPGTRIPMLSDSGLAMSLVPPVANRVRRLRAMGGFALDRGGATAASAAETPALPAETRPTARPAATIGRFPRWLGILILAPVFALVGVLLVIVAALIVYLVALAAFIILSLVAGPIHELLRGLAGG
jgi:Zn-dependent protease with chaperone function